MNFERSFRIVSYGVVCCGFLSMWVSGTFGIVATLLFAAAVVTAWYIEDSRWQISEWLGTALIVAAVPGYYFAWKFRLLEFSSNESMLPGLLARLILSLSVIKLLQKKGDRDWIFLYLMSFFEVLLGAGLTISAAYLLSFIFYIFLAACAVVMFEMRRTRHEVEKRLKKERNETDGFSVFKIPKTAIVLIFLIVAFAAPVFFLLPRVGGAGIGGTGSVSAASGFSDLVRLGNIGRIQQSDEVVMRIRVEGQQGNAGGLRWRGLALDTFDGKSWSRSNSAKEPRPKGDRDLIQVGYASGRGALTQQTVYLEPLDIPILFALSRPIAVKGNFNYIDRDSQGSLSFQPRGERISYTVWSDRSRPSTSELLDDSGYPPGFDRFLQLPADLDPRVGRLAEEIGRGANSRYQKASAIESFLQTQFGYTLEQKAGGDQPLSDFLFNIKEGHCEYFATAMTIMLRTQGIAARVVNGFQEGDFN
ncbi:MAG: DUF3488 and transglutaminase-like domain-containing protein, partial [Acidobacteriota bacterium]